MLRKEVRYVAFPDTEDGRLSFYHEPVPDHSQCASPKYYYTSGKTWGYCHIQNPSEMDSLALQVGAMTREEFQQKRLADGFKVWKDAYAEYLSVELGRLLQEEKGIVLTIKGEEVQFFCPKGMFVSWEKKKR